MKSLASLFAAALLVFSSAAHAHAHLASSTPAEGSTVSAAPPSIELKFSEAVRLTAVSVQKGDEKKQPLAALPEKASDKISLALPALAPGKYSVNYRGVSADNHVVSGAIHFTVSAS